MKLPRNGKVVIIDDKISEVATLMTALSSEAIPFTYYQDEMGKDLPSHPLKNIRLVFLDLELQTDISTLNSKDIIGSAIIRLRKILGKENGPYILAIWSTRYDEYGDAFFKELNNKRNLYIQPITKVVLEKSKIKDAFSDIKSAINSEIDANNSLKTLLVWESIINESAGEITNDFVVVANADEKVNYRLNVLLHKLACAHFGEQIKNVDGKEQVRGCYSILNNTLSDRIDQNIRNHNQGDLFNDMSEDILKEDSLFASKINNMLHLVKDNTVESICPGSMALPLETIKSTEFSLSDSETLRTYLKYDFFTERYESLIRGAFEYNENQLIEDIIKDSGYYVELNVTPPCDYAQDKMVLCRILPGILFSIDEMYPKIKKGQGKLEYIRKFLKHADYLFQSDFSIEINNKRYMLILDFRYLYGLSKERVNKVKSHYRIKDKLLNDIQVKLSGHVNRVGLLYL